MMMRMTKETTASGLAKKFLATTLPGLAKPEIGSRIIMTPEHAKRLMNALFDNISKYEAQFGVIDLGGKGPQPGGTFNLADFGPLGGSGNKS